jgi:hypothetical protein
MVRYTSTKGHTQRLAPLLKELLVRYADERNSNPMVRYNIKTPSGRFMLGFREFPLGFAE